MVKKRGANQRTGGKPFLEWCAENGERGERLANEFREELPTELTKASHYKAKWKCLNVQARVEGEGEQPHEERQTQRVSDSARITRRRARRRTSSRGARRTASSGKKLSREYVDKDKPPTAVTKASSYKALWKCGSARTSGARG